MTSRKTKSENPETNGYKNSQDAYEAWRDFYQKMTDESMAFYQQGMEMFQKMTPFYPAAQGGVFKEWINNYQAFVDRVREETGGMMPMDMESYRRMYEAWLDTWTRNLESYMRTPEFVAKSGKDLEAFADVQSKFGEMMEAYWHTMHLPSTEDMKEVYHKLYLIDRKLDDMDRRMSELIAASKSSASAKK